MDVIRICTGYRVDGRALDLLPTGAEAVAECKPVYEELPGWTRYHVGVNHFDALACTRTRYLMSDRER